MFVFFRCNLLFLAFACRMCLPDDRNTTTSTEILSNITQFLLSPDGEGGSYDMSMTQISEANIISPSFHKMDYPGLAYSFTLDRRK